MPLAQCCGRLHAGAAAATAEQLMRSRYSAFAVGDAPYLLRSWHSSTRPKGLTLDPAQVWSRLVIVGSTGGGLFDQEGTVEFRALYSHRGSTSSLHEYSRFLREDGAWLYLAALPS
jgi:SEC-C motif-containing protein